MGKIKHLILWLLIPFQKWVQRLGYVENSFTQEDIDRMYDTLKPGDILGSYESGRFTSMFIKGEYDHSAMVTDTKEVIEAIGDKYVNGINVGGVRLVPLKEWLWKKNHIYAMRHKNNMIAEKASKSYYTLLNMKYDYTFDRGNEKMYCSEIPYVCYNQHDPNFLSNVPSDKEILPIDYLSCTDLELIFDTRRKF
jgi:uncharacterized protein YycO